MKVSVMVDAGSVISSVIVDMAAVTETVYVTMEGQVSDIGLSQGAHVNDVEKQFSWGLPVEGGSIIVTVDAGLEIVEMKETVTVEIADAEEHVELLGLFVIEMLLLVGDVVRWVVVVGVELDPTKQEHTLESLDDEDEQAEANEEIAKAGETVYV
jgi:hypothetical protein